MKTLFSTLSCLFLALSVSAASYLVPKVSPREVGLAWDPSPSLEVSGYNIYVGVLPRSYTNIVKFGNVTSCVISNLVPGVRYFFTATAYDAQGNESEWCNEVYWLVPMTINPPANIRASNTVVRVTVEQSPRPNKGPWTEFATMSTQTAFPGYYRSTVSIDLPVVAQISGDPYLLPRSDRMSSSPPPVPGR